MEENFKERDSKYTVYDDEVFHLYHVAVVSASTTEELQDNLNEMATFIQCEHKGNIDDVKLTVNDFGGKLNYTAIITYYHTLLKVENEEVILNEDEEIVFDDSEEE